MISSASSPAFKPRDLWAVTARLRQFEAWGGVWRGAISLVRLVLEQALPVVAAVLVALITVNGRAAQAAVSAALALILNGLFRSFRAKFPWHTPVSARLGRWEALNPPSEIPVLVSGEGVRVARLALRRARFNPRIYTVRHGVVPPDAPDLEHEIKVHEPEAFPQSASDDDRVRRIVHALQAAGIRARVAGVDVLARVDAAP